MSSKHDIIRIRRGTAAEWAASEPQPGGEILKLGEPGYEKDTGKLKIGDGVTPWNSLSYFSDGAAVDPEVIQDIIGLNPAAGGFLVAGSGIGLSYLDEPQDQLEISVVGHLHDIAQITDFDSGVSGLLPSVTGTGYINSVFNNNLYTISVTGLQPSGNYSIVGHTHTASEISDSTSFGRDILTAASYAAQNKLGWQIVNTSITAVAGGQYLLPKYGGIFSPTDLTISDPASANFGDMYMVIKQAGNKTSNTIIGGVSYSTNADIFVIRIYGIDSAFPAQSSWKSFNILSEAAGVRSLGTLTGANNINYLSDRQIQTLTLNGTAVTFNKGSGWPTSSTESVDVVLKLNVTSPTTITWTIVNEWYNQAPAGALSVDNHIFLLRAVGTTIEGHYIGNQTN